jgi:hypothetical protein
MLKHRLALLAAVVAAAVLLTAWFGLATTGARSLPAGQRGAVAGSDPMLRNAIRRYRQEAQGQVAKNTLARVARERGLVAAVRSGSTARLRAYVAGRFRPVWYHWHVSRLRITLVRGGVVETGVPFVVAGPQRVLRDTRGRAVATLQISIQDAIGYVRYMHRNAHVDVVVHGRGPTHVRTSLPAALRVRLPGSGQVTIAGRRHVVTSFHQRGWLGEPLTIWILR